MVCFAVPRSTRPGIYLWDLPTRACHWALAATVGFAFATGFIGGNLMELHGKAGIAIVGLVAFRIMWGIVGSTYARFASFVRGPAAIREALAGTWRGIGHNPLGAFSVLGLLALATLQTATGLFANDDISFNGPLYALVSKETSDLLTGIHHNSVWVLGALIGLHLAAIVFYVRVKKDDLVRPMLTGWKDEPQVQAESARGGGPLAFVVALLVALACGWVAAGGLLPPPAAPATTAAPTW